MQVEIEVLKQIDGWRVDIRAPSCAVPPRLLGTSATGMPLPPLEEKPFWNGRGLADLFEPANAGKMLFDLHKDVVRGSLTSEGVALYSDYLLATLLGPHWADIEQSAPANETIELDLYLVPTDQVMQRLNWERLLARNEPLGRTVAVTRVIAADGVRSAKAELALPLRTLFVVGAQFDESLRPGAEYVSLVRHLEAARVSPTAARSVDIEVELLVEATTEEIRSKVAEFKPSVVHVIAHGRWDRDNPQVILTKRQEPGEASVEPDPCDAQRLFDAICAIPDESGLLRPPPIVVLNACHTGEPNEAYLPYAARLAQQGVLIALGMAGEIADGASRIFTRAFYQALIDRQMVTVAAAVARRAAMLHFSNLELNVEWARPTMFLRAGAPRTIEVNRPRQILAATAFQYRPRSGPEILCDRLSVLDGYQSFRNRILRGDHRSALAFEVSDDKTTVQAPVGSAFQIGKTRVLGEIAARAIFDGFVPCILPSGSGFQPPSNLLRFAIRLAEVMDDARTNFLDADGKALAGRRRESEALKLAAGLVKQKLNPFTPTGAVQFNLEKKAITDAIEALQGASSMPHGDVLDIIGLDAKLLLADANHLIGETGEKPFFHSLLVLIDDLHGYEGLALELLESVLAAGLSRDAACAAVAFTYSTRADRGADIMNFIKDKQAVQTVPLRPFQDPWESRLSYAQMLLARPRPLAPTWDPGSRGHVNIMFKLMHDKIKGVPSFFDLANDIIETCFQLKVLVEADDRALIGIR